MFVFSTTIQTTAELFHTNEESGLFGQLETVRAESAATKEELASYKEKAEKLQEELLVKLITQLLFLPILFQSVYSLNMKTISDL